MDKKKFAWGVIAVIFGLGLLIFWNGNIRPDGFNFFSILWLIGGVAGIILGVRETVQAVKQNG